MVNILINIPLFTGFHTCQVVVWDFWTINNITREIDSGIAWSPQKMGPKWLFRVPGPVSIIPPFFHRTHGSHGRKELAVRRLENSHSGDQTFGYRKKSGEKSYNFWNAGIFEPWGGGETPLRIIQLTYQHPPTGGVQTLRGCRMAPLTIHLARVKFYLHLNVPEHVLKAIFHGSQQLPQQLPPLPRYNDPLQPSVRWYQWTHHWAWPPGFFREFKVHRYP